MLRSLKNWFGGKRPPQAPSKAKACPSRRLGLETLEDRLVLSGGVTPGYLLDNGGNLYNTAGSQQQLIDTGVKNFAVANSKVYDLHNNGTLESMNSNGSAKVTLGSGVTSFAVAGNGWLYEVQNGNLFRNAPNSTSSTMIDSQVTSLASSPDGWVYEVNHGGTLTRWAPNGGGWSAIDAQVTSLASSPDGWVYEVNHGGNLTRWTPGGGGWTLIDTQVSSLGVAPDGWVYEVNHGGNLTRWTPGGGGWTLIDTQVTSLASSPDDWVYELNHGGTLTRWAPGGGGWSVIDRLDSSFTVGANGSLTLNDWFSQNLSDAGLQSLVRADLVDHASIGRGDMLGLFSQVEADGVVTGSELQSLKVVIGNAGVLQMPDYVRSLASDMVNGDPANAHYQGSTLGNLFAGSSSGQLQKLVDKWFLGMDHPTAGASYSAVSGPLFSPSGPSYTDVYQGSLNNCTVMASLAVTAARTTLVSGMFITNGDGTWTVRFFHNGTPVYVTVDNQLPGGGGAYDHPNGVLWAALAEKAYAELNESGWLGTLSPGSNSYFALNNGNTNTIVAALSAITGRSSSTFSTGSADLAMAMSQGKLVVLATGDSTGNATIEHNHAYAVVGYNAGATQPFTLFNPWGINGGKGDNGVSIAGQLTANAAAIKAYFVAGGWTGAASGTAPAAEIASANVVRRAFLRHQMADLPFDAASDTARTYPSLGRADAEPQADHATPAGRTAAVDAVFSAPGVFDFDAAIAPGSGNALVPPEGVDGRRGNGVGSYSPSRR